MKKFVILGVTTMLVFAMGTVALAANADTTRGKDTYSVGNTKEVSLNSNSHEEVKGCYFVDKDENGICDNGDKHNNSKTYIDDNKDGICDNNDNCQNKSQQNESHNNHNNDKLNHLGNDSNESKHSGSHSQGKHHK